MRLGGRYDLGQLELVPKHLHCVFSGEKEAKPITHTPLHLPADEQHNLRGACRRMGPFCDSALQGQSHPGKSYVKQDDLLYIVL